MIKNADTIDLFNFNLETGKEKAYIPLCYQIFGQPLGSARVVVVHYVLTENAATTETCKTIDTDHFTVLVFTLQLRSGFTPRDIARIFWEGLLYLGIKEVFTIVGNYLNKEIASEMTALHPTKIKGLLPAPGDSINKRPMKNIVVVFLKKAMWKNKKKQIISLLPLRMALKTVSNMSRSNKQTNKNTLNEIRFYGFGRSFFSFLHVVGILHQ